MGNNYAKRLGIRPQKVIGSKDFQLLWSKYAEDGGKKISRKNAKKFLKDFVVAVKVKYDPELASELIRDCDPMHTGWLDEDQFASLFFASTRATAHLNELHLTASLAEKQRKINKEVDRDAGSGSAPSAEGPPKIEIRIEKAPTILSEKKKKHDTLPPQQQPQQLQLQQTPQPQQRPPKHDSVSDAKSELTQNSECEDSINSNAKSDLTGSASHVFLPTDRFDRPRDLT
eukprot:TRINITY_DN4164_c0_g1_i1.p1 TRINITY_DN4164_c0_g1~~TRINITY_DN4164_c0_g1_i1.p1  ORF type:complete len:229 (+),score=32.18 TRINITY_DN4164_c0_g1_i1:29-715(+)